MTYGCGCVVVQSLVIVNYKFNQLEMVRIISMRNGNTNYLSHLKSYLRGEKIKQIEILRWQYISTSAVNICIGTQLRKPVSNLQTNLFRIYLPKNGPTYRGQVVNPQPQTRIGQPVTKPETSQQIILVRTILFYCEWLSQITSLSHHVMPWSYIYIYIYCAYWVQSFKICWSFWICFNSSFLHDFIFSKDHHEMSRAFCPIVIKISAALLSDDIYIKSIILICHIYKYNEFSSLAP